MMKKLFLPGSAMSQFMQVLSIGLLTAAVFMYVRRRRRKRRFSSVNRGLEVVPTVFVCYLAGLLPLARTSGNFWTYIWFYLFCGYPGTTIRPMLGCEGIAWKPLFLRP